MLLISFAPSWFIQGLLHPLQTPSHLLLLLGLGLLIGQQRRLRLPLLLFGTSIVTGLILNQFIKLNFNFELILLILALIISLLVIIKSHLLASIPLFLVTISGIGIGLNSSPIIIPGLGSASVYNWLFGASCSLVGVILLTTLIAYFINSFWQGIILRVLSSWIATSAIFVLTFMLVKL